MDNIQSTLNRLNSETVSTDEIKRCLSSSNILVKSNAILAVVHMSVSDTETIHQLSKIAESMNKEPHVLGLWNSGHFAAAALRLLNTQATLDEFKELTSGFTDSQKEDIERLISAWPM